MWEWIVYWVLTGLRCLGYIAWAWMLVGVIVSPVAFRAARAWIAQK